MTTRQGVCLLCGTEITLVVTKVDLDASRFYWGDTARCPMCSLIEVKMGVVKE